MKRIDLSKQHAHVWYANLKKDSNKLYQYYDLLSFEEKQKARQFKFSKDKNQSIITRIVLRLLSSKYLNIKPEAVTFKYGEYGKPEYNFDSDLKFNISHSGDLIVIGFVKDFDIGVDIEKVKYNFDVFEIASKFFSALEIETLKKVHKTKQVEYFYRCWTRKESFIKAKSVGLSFPLDSFSVCIDSDKKTKLLETKWDDTEKHKWQLFTFTPLPNYIGAASVKGNIDGVAFFKFNN